jgi:hypothetical protein
MITADGYSKTNEPPVGIAVTWGKDLISEKGGLLSFVRFFEKCMQTEDDVWLQKCKNAPKLDIIYVYIIVCNQVRYRCFYGGHATGQTSIRTGDGHSWSRSSLIMWPRLILVGPFKKAPVKIIRPGFQGFRYTTQLF